MQIKIKITLTCTLTGRTHTLEAEVMQLSEGVDLALFYCDMARKWERVELSAYIADLWMVIDRSMWDRVDLAAA